MSVDDLLLLGSWGMFGILSCQVTVHLYRDLGVLVASQSFIMTISALAYTQLSRAGGDSVMGIIGAIAVGGLLGLLHVPVLLQVGPYLMLVVTAIAQIVLTQFWLAVPYVTGGSGGLLLASHEVGMHDVGMDAAVVFLVLTLSGWYVFGIGEKGLRRFDLACIRDSGMRAGALGVPSLRFYVFGFLLYGIALAVCGVAAVRLLGYLTTDLFGLSWALTNVLITLIARDRSSALIVALAVLYATTRIGLRQILMASPAWAQGLEVLFPALLLIFFAIRVVHARGASYIAE